MRILFQALDWILNFIAQLFKTTNTESKPAQIEFKDEKKEDVVKPVHTGPLIISDKTKRVVYSITSAFEGAKLGKINFENITGNFDGQGLSIGFLQWCTGQGSDYPLFQKMAKKHPDVLKKIFGDLYDKFIHMLSMSQKDRLSWAVGINNNKNQIVEPWKSAIVNLCRTSEFQQVQMDAAESKLQEAVKYCDDYGVKSIRALALMFDIMTQNGSIKKTTRERIFQKKKEKETDLGISSLKEKDFLTIIAVERANDSNPRWVADVKARKLCIVNGSGHVHGETFELDKIGLSDEPFRTVE